MRRLVSLLVALVLLVALAAPVTARTIPYGPCVSDGFGGCQFDGIVPPPIR